MNSDRSIGDNLGSAGVTTQRFRIDPSASCAISVVAERTSRQNKLRQSQVYQMLRDLFSDGICVSAVGESLVFVTFMCVVGQCLGCDSTIRLWLEYTGTPPHNDVSVNDGPHIRRWSHKIIILQYLPLCYNCLQ